MWMAIVSTTMLLLYALLRQRVGPFGRLGHATVENTTRYSYICRWLAYLVKP